MMLKGLDQVLGLVVTRPLIGKELRIRGQDHIDVKEWLDWWLTSAGSTLYLHDIALTVLDDLVWTMFERMQDELKMEQYII